MATWRTLSQASFAASDDVNQELTLHSFVVTYPNNPQWKFATHDAIYHNGYIQLPNDNTYAYSQEFNISATSVAMIEIPVTFTNLASPTQSYPNVLASDALDVSTPVDVTQPTQFSGAVDVTVSIQTTTGSFGSTFPSGTAVSTTSTIKVPGRVIEGLNKDAWTGPNMMVASQPLPSQTSNLPIAFVSTTATAAFTFPSSGTFTLNVASTTNFPTSGQLWVWLNNAYAYIAYTGTTGSSFTGCSVTNAGTDTNVAGFAAGVTVQQKPPASFAYVVAGDWLFTVNAFSSVHPNTAYFASYVGNGTLAQWQVGTDLPEYNCSVAYTPSSSNFFAIGPSGAMYQASFDPVAGILGAWMTMPPTGAITSFPSYSGAYTPAMCAGTIDNIDYLFVMGGYTSTGPQYTAYCAPIDAYGNVSEFVSINSLPWAAYQGTGLQAFYANGYLYLANAGVTDVQLITLPVWVDTSGVFHTGTWSFALHDAFATNMFGYAYNNVVTDYGMTGLTTGGYGSTDATTPVPSTQGPNGAAIPFPHGAVFENSDGSASIICSNGYILNAYPMTWLQVPISCTLTGGYQLVISTSSTANTNFGVNVLTFAAKEPVSGSTKPSFCYLNAYGWHHSTSNQLIPFSVYDNTGHILGGIIEENGQKWSTLLYDFPNHILTAVTETTWDATQSSSTYAMLALDYDGLGSKNASEPTLMSITEVI